MSCLLIMCRTRQCGIQETNRQLVGSQYIRCDALRKGMGWRGEERRRNQREKKGESKK
jgi:hypothetical protein